MRDTKLNFNGYCLSRAPDFDLDTFNITFGFARIGKSTQACQLQKRYYAFRNEIPFAEINDWILKNHILKKTVLHTQKQNATELIVHSKEQFLWIDEGYLFGDRRRALTDQLIDLSHDVNTNADNNNIFFMLIQDLSDLDLRFVSKANTLTGITERGSGLLFASHKHFAIIKDSYNFEFLKKHQNLLNTYEKGLDTLKKLPAFTFTESWKTLQKYVKDEHGNIVKDENGDKKLAWIDDVFKQYKADKKYWKTQTAEFAVQQQEALKNRDIEFIERYKT